MEDNANYKKAVDILSTRSILKESFSVNEIELFVKQTNFQRYKKKVKIISKHEPAISIICLIVGEASVIAMEHKLRTLSLFRISSYNRDRCLNLCFDCYMSNDYQLRILKGGDIFGESMFSDKGIRTADVIASTDASVVIFTVEDYERLAKISPSIARKYKLFFETMNITLKVLESLRNECG